ncbi:MAG TPA: GNAT family N-acetyltransferase [Streptosporangiaceae bacterium]|nr:GNAT family N-acetyltransferase [Streptosporangiaceae bacterium]
MSPSYPIRTIAPDEFDIFSAVPGHAFLDEWPAEDREIERPVTEFDRTIAAFDGEQMVGTASAYTFRLTVPGGTADAAGVSLVSVLPSHRRRGILTDMMRYQFSDAGRRGEAIAILYASESGIYGRYGFGLASWHERIQIRRGDGRLTVGRAAPSSGDLSLRLADPADVRSDLAKLFVAVLPTRPGMLSRSDAWWDILLADAPSRRDGMSPLRCLLAEDAAGLRGYALYRTKGGWADGLPDGALVVRELTALDPAATAALWTDLFSRDLVSEVSAVHRPVDDPLLAMLADPRRALPLVGDALWVRLIDLPTAMVQRKYASAVDVVLEAQDGFLPENAGRWRLTSSGPDAGGNARCERTTAPADVLLSVQALGAGYLGGASFGQLAAAGHVSERTPGAVARLATAMSWDPRPWCSMMF